MKQTLLKLSKLELKELRIKLIERKEKYWYYCISKIKWNLYYKSCY